MPLSAKTSANPQANFRLISAADNKAIAAIIRAVMTEFNCTGEGFAIHDPEVDCMYETYTHQAARSAYFIVEADGKIVGGGGVAPLRGTYQNICELQKFYIIPEYRGRGFGRELMNLCLDFARKNNFQRCYIETVAKMDRAGELYKKFNFEPIGMPLGNTGHHSCDRWYARVLESDNG